MRSMPPHDAASFKIALVRALNSFTTWTDSVSTRLFSASFPRLRWRYGEACNDFHLAMRNCQSGSGSHSVVSCFLRTASAQLASNSHQLYCRSMHEVLLIAQLLAHESGEGFQSWVDSRPPEELCELYMTGMIDDSMLPGGRATDPCQTVDDASRYLPK